MGFVQTVQHVESDTAGRGRRWPSLSRFTGRLTLAHVMHGVFDFLTRDVGKVTNDTWVALCENCNLSGCQGRGIALQWQAVVSMQADIQKQKAAITWYSAWAIHPR